MKQGFAKRNIVIVIVLFLVALILWLVATKAIEVIFVQFDDTKSFTSGTNPTQNMKVIDLDKKIPSIPKMNSYMPEKQKIYDFYFYKMLPLIIVLMFISTGFFLYQYIFVARKPEISRAEEVPSSVKEEEVTEAVVETIGQPEEKDISSKREKLAEAISKDSQKAAKILTEYIKEDEL